MATKSTIHETRQINQGIDNSTCLSYTITTLMPDNLGIFNIFRQLCQIYVMQKKHLDKQKRGL